MPILKFFLLVGNGDARPRRKTRHAKTPTHQKATAGRVENRHATSKTSPQMRATHARTQGHARETTQATPRQSPRPTKLETRISRAKRAHKASHGRTIQRAARYAKPHATRARMLRKANETSRKEQKRAAKGKSELQAAKAKASRKSKSEPRVAISRQSHMRAVLLRTLAHTHAKTRTQNGASVLCRWPPLAR